MVFIAEHIEKVAAFVVVFVEGLPPVTHAVAIVYRRVVRR